MAEGRDELSPRGEIVIDDRGHTSVPGVFAAGDATTEALQADRGGDGRWLHRGPVRLRLLIRIPPEQRAPSGESARRRVRRAWGSNDEPARPARPQVPGALADQPFRSAAEACFVSQPTLSTQIRKLEDELGVALVERAPRKVMLTPVGRDIAERARRVVAEVEQMKESRASQPRPPGRHRAARSCSRRSGPTCCRTWCRRLRARVSTQLELLLVEEKTEVILRACAKAGSTPGCWRCRCTTTSCTRIPVRGTVPAGRARGRTLSHNALR
jgi:hypothetical protein